MVSSASRERLEMPKNSVMLSHELLFAGFAGFGGSGTNSAASCFALTADEAGGKSDVLFF
jgi:hypothetical protein